MKSSFFSQSGSMLIEALVALVVVGVGTFGIVKLNTVMLSGTGLSKTRAEALHIGQKRMEDIRNFSVQSGCPAVDTGSTEANVVTGVNASYKVGRTVSSVISERVNVDIYVGWDGVADPRNSATDKRIVLSSVVACVGSRGSGMASGQALFLNGGTLKTPTGSARVGGRDNPTCPDGSCVTSINNTNNKPDNTKIYKTGDLVELVDTVTNKVLLTVKDGSDFSTISGRVFIEANSSGNAIVDADGTIANNGTAASTADDMVFILSSDASYCARIFPTDDASKIPSGSSGNGIKYRYFDYNCYVSKGWWGNIGVVRLDNPNANNRVCVGDLAVSSSETAIWSKKPLLSISRSYRAYRKINANGSATDPTNFDTTGIGYSLNYGTVSSTYAAVNLGASGDTTHHDFLITTITGQGTCESSGNMKLVSGNTNTNNLFTGNLGKYYCMSGQCPSLTQTVGTQTTVVRGTITKGTGSVLTGVDPADCQTTPTFTDNGSFYSYSCTKAWTGFAGSAWQGGVTFTTPTSPSTGSATTICPNSTGSIATALPAGNAVASTVNNKNSSINPNSLSFTDVPLAVTDVTIDFDAKASQCAALGQPSLAWSSGTLTWPNISSATSYLIKTCTFSGSITTCTPDTSVGTSTSPYTPGSIPNGQKGRCISVTAQDSSNTFAESAASSPKCVKSGNGGNPSTYN